MRMVRARAAIYAKIYLFDQGVVLPTVIKSPVLCASQPDDIYRKRRGRSVLLSSSLVHASLGVIRVHGLRPRHCIVLFIRSVYYLNVLHITPRPLLLIET